MQAGSARLLRRIEINFVDSFAKIVPYLREYKRILFGCGGGGEGILYKEMTGHGLDDRISNPGRDVVLMLQLGRTQPSIQSMM
jgi:hypothetical protein